MQVRRADQALCHHELTVSSLGSVCQSCTAPLQKHGRSFTSIQMVHAHTLPQEGEKLRSGQWNENEIEGKWIWGEDENEMKVT